MKGVKRCAWSQLSILFLFYKYIKNHQKDHQEDSDLSDDDDNFSLNSSKETEAILTAALPVNRRHETSYLGSYLLNIESTVLC